MVPSNNLINNLQFQVQVPCIFFCLSNLRVDANRSDTGFVRCSLMKVGDPRIFLRAERTSDLAFLVVKHTIIRRARSRAFFFRRWQTEISLAVMSGN